MEKKKRRRRIKHTEAYKLKHRLARGTKFESVKSQALSPGMATAMEQSLVDEVNSRMAGASIADTPTPQYREVKPIFWLWWVLLGVLGVVLVGVMVAKALF